MSTEKDLDFKLKTIYVHGMPLMHRGWNGEYKQLDDGTSNYHLVNHNYYGIGIRHAQIEPIKDGGWKLCIRDKSMGDGVIIVITKNKDVESDWGDILVTRNNDINTWVRSNWA